jgi:hypothetical protein
MTAMTHRPVHAHANATLRMSSACAAAGSCMQHVRARQAQAVQEVVRARRTGRKPTSTFYHLNTFKQDAPWRSQPATDRQLQMLKQLEVRCNAVLSLTGSLGLSITMLAVGLQ